MQLRDRQSCFLLEIKGYEFPGLGDVIDDADWLIIAVTVRSQRGPWRAVFPSLRTMEVKRLAHWLDSLSSGMVNEQRLCFMEPNLEFEVRNVDEKKITVRIYFEMEYRPPWARTCIAGLYDIWVELRVTRVDIKTAAESLKLDLLQFPVRSTRSHRGLSMYKAYFRAKEYFSKKADLFFGEKDP